MTELAPFRGVRYNQKIVKDISRIVSPPYDVISPRKQSSLYKRHAYNIVRIDFGKAFPRDDSRNNRYIRARKFFERWLKEGVLIRDDCPSIYLYRQTYFYKGKKFSRPGFISRLKLKDDGSVFAHEKTSAQHKNDRLRLLKAVKANINPVFSIFSDDSGIIRSLAASYSRMSPLIDVNIERVRHRLWRISDSRQIKKINRSLCRKKIFIADGHHRFEVSLAYQDYCRKKNPKHTGREDYNYVMMYFAALEDEALKILPTHRLLKKLPPKLESHLRNYFDIAVCGRGEDIFSLMAELGGREHIFGMYLGAKKFCLLRLRKDLKLKKLIPQKKPLSWKKLDVSILHSLVIEKFFGIKNSDFKSVFYTQDVREAIRRVDSGAFKVAFFLNPTRPYQVKQVASEDARMPHKSTYFYPKLLSGLIINQV